MRIVFSLIFSFVLLINTAFAAGKLPNANNFIAAGVNGQYIKTPELIDNIDVNLGGGLVAILQVIYNIGVIVAICVMVFMAIQVIIASPQQKAQLKASLFPYFTGLLLFIAGVPIAILIINIIMQIF